MLTPKECGFRNEVNGGSKFEAAYGEWPNMCVIYRKHTITDEENVEYLAGASLITPGILLTAAHWVV